MFLFTDAHVADEGFLELVNNMLTSGMVPALYDNAEKDGLTAGVAEEVGDRKGGGWVGGWVNGWVNGVCGGERMAWR